jgi:hypothetical protein
MKYIFRGVVVFDYDPILKQMKVPNRLPLEGGGYHNNNFNHCMFIADDYALIAQFFHQAHLHATGQIGNDDLKDITVN